MEYRLPYTVDELRRMTPDELRSAMAVLEGRAVELHQDPDGELRHLSGDEEAEFNGLMNLMRVAKGHAAIGGGLRRGGRSVRTAYPGGATRSYDISPDEVRTMSGPQARDAALRILEQRGRHLAPEQGDRVDQLVRTVADEDSPHMDGSMLARRIALTENEHYRSAWSRMMSSDRPLLSESEIGAIREFKAFERAEERALGSGGAPDAGVGIPVFIDPSVIMTAQGSANPVWRISKIVDVNTNIWKGVSSAGMTWSFDGAEPGSSAVSDDSPAFAQPTASIFTARGFIPFAAEIGEDYPGFATEIAGLLAEGYDELLSDKLVTGSGSNEPNGVLTVISASAGARVRVTTAGNLGPDDAYKVWNALPFRHRMRANWLMDVSVNNKLRAGATADGSALTVRMPAAWADVILGHEVYESPYMPATTTSTSATTAYALVGDFSRQFIIARRLGMSTEYVQNLFDTTTGRPTGQRGWLSRARVGSTVVSTSGFRLLVNTG